MDRDYVQRYGLVERYLKGALSAEEAAAFEEHYLECPETLEEVEQGWALQEGLRAGAGQGSRAYRFVPPVFRGRPGVGAAAMAAACLVIVVPTILAVALFDRNQALEKRLTAPVAPQANLPVVTLFNARSAQNEGDITTLKLGPEQETVVLEIDPGEEGAPPFTVVMSAEGSEKNLITVSGLRPDKRGYLVSAIPGSRLDHGIYRVEVRTSSGTVVAGFSVRVDEQEMNGSLGNSG